MIKLTVKHLYHIFFMEKCPLIHLLNWRRAHFDCSSFPHALVCVFLKSWLSNFVVTFFPLISMRDGAIWKCISRNGMVFNIIYSSPSGEEPSITTGIHIQRLSISIHLKLSLSLCPVVRIPLTPHTSSNIFFLLINDALSTTWI